VRESGENFDFLNSHKRKKPPALRGGVWAASFSTSYGDTNIDNKSQKSNSNMNLFFKFF